MLLGVLGNRLVLTGIVLVVVATGVTLQQLGSRDQAIPFHTIYYGGGGREAGFLVINDNVTWSQVSALNVPGYPFPKVNFTSRTVIAAFLGGRPTGGYGINITSATLHGSDVIVNIAVITVGPNCAVTQATTTWAHIVDVPKIHTRVLFNNSTIVRNC